MKAFKIFVAAAFFMTSLTFHEQVLKTSDNVLTSKWSATFGMQTSHALALYYEEIAVVNFE